MKTRDTKPQARWTLEELCELVMRALAQGYAEPANRQVRAIPDARTIRYYTTLGLLDRPAEMRGRTAYYGRRHLLQIVTIKRLQAQGLPLAEIQRKLAGLSGTVLEDIAQVPQEDTFAAAGGFAMPRAVAEGALAMPAPDAVAEFETARRETAFWVATPAPVALKPEAPGAAGRAQTLELNGHALLTLLKAKELSYEDIEVLRRAAAPLLEVLQTRGLVKEGKS